MKIHKNKPCDVVISTSSLFSAVVTTRIMKFSMKLLINSMFTLKLILSVNLSGILTLFNNSSYHLVPTLKLTLTRSIILSVMNQRTFNFFRGISFFISAIHIRRIFLMINLWTNELLLYSSLYPSIQCCCSGKYYIFETCNFFCNHQWYNYEILCDASHKNLVSLLYNLVCLSVCSTYSFRQSTWKFFYYYMEVVILILNHFNIQIKSLNYQI